MELTIEKAKEIVKHYLKTDELIKGDIHGSDMAIGFIEGWNQAIDKAISVFQEKGIYLWITPDQYLTLKKSKVE